jgi:hypothetical protein
MTLKNFRLLLQLFTRKVPFEPFEVELNSGSRVRVSHPESVIIEGDEAAKNIKVVHRMPSGGHTIYEIDAVVGFFQQPARP